MKGRYSIFSPYTTFHLSMLYVYVIPVVFYGNDKVSFYSSLLDTYAYSLLILYLRIFSYLFFLFSIFTINRVSKLKIRQIDYTERLTPRFVIRINVLLLSIWFWGQFCWVGFNPRIMIMRLFYPRNFTYLTEGYGVLNLLVGSSKFLLLFINISYYFKHKNFVSFCYLIIAIFSNILGGNKSSLLRILIFFVLIWVTTSKVKIKAGKVILVFFILVVVFFMSFNIMRTSTQERITSISKFLNRIFWYSQESYYSGRVINDYGFDISHWAEVLKSVLFVPIPRSMFSNKSYYGLYNSFWRPHYLSTTVQYHTSTFGFLAEGVMLFGVFSPIIYAFLFSFICYKVYIWYIYKKNVIYYYSAIFIVSEIYFLVRGGLFQASTIWMIILYIILAKIWIQLIGFFSHKIKGWIHA